MKEITIRIDDYLYVLLHVVADDQEISPDEIVACALEPYLKIWAPPGHEDSNTNRH